MMNFKQMIAIAVTLIVVVPIGVGYALSNHDETSTEYVRDSYTYNVSDMLLNSEASVTENYVGFANNFYTCTTGSIYFAPDYVTTTTTVNECPTGTGRYGVVNDGWTMADGCVAWTNYRLNTHVYTYIDLGDTSTVRLKGGDVTDLSSGGDYTLEIARAGSITTYVFYTTDGHTGSSGILGDHRYVIVEMTSTIPPSITLLDGPLAYGEEPPGPITEVSFISPYWHCPQGTLKCVSMWSSGDAVFRVDKTTVETDTFACTEDEVFEPLSVFKNYGGWGTVVTGVDMYLSGADRYGTTLRLGLTSFSVTNGSITVDGETVRLKGATIRVAPTPDDLNGRYTMSINGHVIADDLDAQNCIVRFGGVWVLNATEYTLKATTVTTNVWTPGEFGLDRTGIAAVGLLVCGGLLVGLGMTGARSGAKIGALLLICGGAALVYIMLI